MRKRNRIIIDGFDNDKSVLINCTLIPLDEYKEEEEMNECKKTITCAMYFDETSSLFDPVDTQSNIIYIESIMTLLDSCIKTNGFVTYMDFLRHFGIKPSKNSFTAGWVSSEMDHIEYKIDSWEDKPGFRIKVEVLPDIGDYFDE